MPHTSSGAPMPLRLAGAYGSPYSLKMRAVLRYRRIPFQWILRDSQWDDLGKAPVALIPVIDFPDAEGNYGDLMVDSSPLIERLEGLYSQRSVVPTDAVVRFIDYLIEDFADEWVTKMMYHYRWYYDDAIAKAGKLLPLDRNLRMPDEVWNKARGFISDRQISRRAFIGSTDNNRPVIEGSYERLLALLNDAFRANHFLVGDRPGAGDFGLFGQLKQLVGWDPESARVAIDIAPRVVNWVERTDDLSWWDVDGADGWCTRAAIPVTTLAILHEIGRTYAPFMIANHAAFASGADETICVIDGVEYRQGPFGYQSKCLMWLRDRYQALNNPDRGDVDVLLRGTGCETLFE